VKSEPAGDLIAYLDRVASVWRIDETHWGIALRGRFELAHGKVFVLADR
jgi:hypothetical protein